MQYFKLCAIRSPWIICEFLYDAHTYFFIINPLHRPTETENKNKNGREEVQSDLLHDLLEFKENLVDERDLSEPQETLSLDIETLPVLLMNFQWSREQKWNRVYTHFAKEYLLEDEINEGFLQKTCWYCRAQSGQFW